MMVRLGLGLVVGITCVLVLALVSFVVSLLFAAGLVTSGLRSVPGLEVGLNLFASFFGLVVAIWVGIGLWGALMPRPKA